MRSSKKCDTHFCVFLVSKQTLSFFHCPYTQFLLIEHVHTIVPVVFSLRSHRLVVFSPYSSLSPLPRLGQTSVLVVAVSSVSSPFFRLSHLAAASWVMPPICLWPCHPKVARSFSKSPGTSGAKHRRLRICRAFILLGYTTMQEVWNDLGSSNH